VVDPEVRAFVGRMQRDAFELPDWDPEANPEHELSPAADTRLRELRCRTLVLVGDLDQPATKDAAAKIAAEVEGSRIVVWPDVAHVPTLERPADFEGLALDFLTGR
jgi:pimeloyl-ACP methyl ester carboxylesterase